MNYAAAHTHTHTHTHAHMHTDSYSYQLLQFSAVVILLHYHCIITLRHINPHYTSV